MGRQKKGAARVRSTPIVRIACCSGAKVFAKEFLATLSAFSGQQHRFRLANGIVDHALIVKATQGIPVVSFPRASLFVKCQIQKGKDHLINFVFVEFHTKINSRRTNGARRLGKYLFLETDA
jgi:hypothetical protein